MAGAVIDFFAEVDVPVVFAPLFWVLVVVFFTAVFFAVVLFVVVFFVVAFLETAVDWVVFFAVETFFFTPVRTTGFLDFRTTT